MGATFQFVRYDLKRLWCSPRPYVILFFVYAVLELCFGCVREYLAETGQQIQATEFFSIAISNRIPQWIIIFGIILLLGDAPFFHDGMEYYIIRSSRTQWLIGQIVFCIVTIVGYVLIVAGMFFFMFAHSISFKNEWSDIIILCCQVRSGAILGITMNMIFPLELIQSGSPYFIFFISCSYLILLMFFLSLVLMLCNLKLKVGIGYFIVVAILVLRVFVDNSFGLKFMHFLSPCNLAVVSGRAVTAYSIAYTFLYFLSTCGVLYMYIYKGIRKADLQKSR